MAPVGGLRNSFRSAKSHTFLGSSTAIASQTVEPHKAREDLTMVVTLLLSKEELSHDSFSPVDSIRDLKRVTKPVN
jgi:hypothetical protein